MRATPRRRGRRAARARSCGASAGILLATAALAAVVGLTALGRADSAPLPPVPPASGPTPAPPPRAAPPIVRAPAPAPDPLRGVAVAVGEAERAARTLRGMSLGADREALRVQAMAALSTARETLGGHLDGHPEDRRGNALWDRLQRVYVTLKKL